MPNPWDALSEKFSAHKKITEIDLDAADNILIAQPTILGQIHEYFQGRKDLSILDYGCGTGTFCENLRMQGYQKITGMDGSVNMVEKAKEQYGQNIEFIHQTAESPLDVDPQDVITGSMVFQFIEDIETTFQNILNLLKPDGLFIFAVHNPAMVTAALQRNLKIFSNFESVEKPERGLIHLGGNAIPIFIRTAAEYDAIMKKFGYKKVCELEPPFTHTFLYTYHPEIADVSNFLILGYHKQR